MAPLFRAAGSEFDRLYRDHAAAVYRYAFAVLGNHSDAEDVTQQTFLNAYRAIAQGTKPRKAENWLVTIAHNEVRRHFRANGKAVEVELDERLPHPDPERSDPSLTDVLRALQKLPPNQRSALVMREFEGRSYAEIAEALELTQSALETLLFRARRMLAEHLEGTLTCAEAEQAVSRRLDGRLPRREARRLKRHLEECPLCVRFVTTQKRQRSLLKGLSVMPVPASLYLFRPEPTTAAGLGASGVAGAAGASAGAGVIGVGAGIAAKAAAVAAVAAVAGGVGYGVAATPDGPVQAQRSARQPALVQPTRDNRPAARVYQRREPLVVRNPASREQKPHKAKKSKAQRAGAKPRRSDVAKAINVPRGLAKKEDAAPKVRPTKPVASPRKAQQPEPRRAKPLKKPRPLAKKTSPPARRPDRAKAERPVEPPADPAAAVHKKPQD